MACGWEEGIGFGGKGGDSGCHQAKVRRVVRRDFQGQGRCIGVVCVTGSYSHVSKRPKFGWGWVVTAGRARGNGKKVHSKLPAPRPDT
jgi:hypothetical protein